MPCGMAVPAMQEHLCQPVFRSTACRLTPPCAMANPLLENHGWSSRDQRMDGVDSWVRIFR
ncbi:MAG: hypothetical protein ACKN9U_19915, partial [Pirellulaceae bacterium]